MMNVLIADDENIVLEGLKYIIDWNQLGFCICGEARNGEETLAKIISLQPDLVLLDIRMPKLYGTDIVQKAKEMQFTGKFIIISGYSDFKYAQTAMKFGVDFYLTKPIDEDELTSAVISISNAIKKEHQTKHSLLQYKEKAKTTILKDILQNTCNYESLDFIDLHLQSPIYQVVIYNNYNQSTFQPSYSFAELLRVSNQENNSYDHIQLMEQEIILLKGPFAMERFASILKHYDTNPQKGSPLDSLFLTYGRPVTKPEHIHLSYEDALKLLNRRFFCEQNQHLLSYEMLPDQGHYTYQIGEETCKFYYELILSYIQTYNRQLLADTLHTLQENLFYAKDNLTCIKLFLTDIYLQIKQIITQTYAANNIPFPSNSLIIELIDRKHYLYEIILFFSEQFEMIMNAIGSSSNDNIFADILNYINHNYKDNIKLETIAPLFGYNSSYLGKIFHKKVGESFNAYLDRIRIEESKHLLAQDQRKVYEVAKIVGYKNVDYFHKKFKKYVGKSPIEYRKHI